MLLNSEWSDLHLLHPILGTILSERKNMTAVGQEDNLGTRKINSMARD